MSQREEALKAAARIIETIGRVFCDPEVNPIYKKYENDNEVFYHLMLFLWPGIATNRPKSIEELKEKPPDPETLWKRYEEILRMGRSEDSYIDSLIDFIVLVGWKTIQIENVAKGILEIVKLWKELNDRGYGLRDLYRYFRDRYGADFLDELLSKLDDIPQIDRKKALMFLRDYIIKSELQSEAPLQELPVLDQPDVKRVMKRVGFTETEDISEVREAAQRYFEVPVIADIGLWYVGRNFCHGNREPECDRCPLKDYCERNL